MSLKAELIEAIGGELEELWGARPDQLNNAYIAFQMTFFRHFLLMHQVLASNDYDLSKTISVFLSMPNKGENFETVSELKSIETEVTNYLMENICILDNNSLQSDNSTAPTTQILN